jgi:phage-related protein
MAEVGKASVEIVGDVRDFARDAKKKLDDALSKLKPRPVEVPLDTDQVAKAGEQAGQDLADGITRGADGRLRNAKGQFVRAGQDLGKGVTDGAVREMRNGSDKISKAGVEAGGKAGDGAGRSFTSRFGKSLSGVSGALKKGFAGIGSMLGRSLSSAGGGVTSALSGIVGAVGTSFKGLFATLPGLILQASPAISAAITAAVGTGLGVAFIGLGAIALRESKPLKNAFKDLRKTLSDVGAQAAKPLLKPFLNSIAVLKSDIKFIKPLLKDIFAGVAPAVKPLTQALSSFVTNVLDGIKDSLPGIRAALDGFGAGLTVVGTALGDFFRQIFANEEVIDNATEGLLRLVAGPLKPLGSLISGLTVIFAAWNNMMKLTTGVWLPMITSAITNFVDGGTGALGRIRDAWGPLGEAIQNVWDKIKAFAGEDDVGKLEARFLEVVAAIKEAWGPLKEFLQVVWDEALATIQRLWNEKFVPWWEGTAEPWIREAFKRAFNAAWDAASEATSNRLSGLTERIGGWLSGLPGRIGGWLRGIPGVFANVFSGALARALTGASQIVSGIRERLSQITGRVRSALSGVRGAVTGAFSGAAGWLRSAGANIINGLVGSIRAGIGRVRSAVGAIAGSIPSWAERILDINSPSRVMEKVGDNTARGLEVGFLGRQSSLQRAVEGVAGSLSGWAAPTGQRGYGATTVTGGLTFNINVSGTSGQQAGQRAAEQVLKQLAAAGLVR